MSARIAGFMMTRDAWPMSGLALAHALEHHVETVWVIDDGSVDDTPAGVAGLQRAFEGRVNYLRLEGTPFLQAAISSVALEWLKDEPSADWIWFVDSDEFGVRGRLADALAGVSRDVGAVRYEVANFVTPCDFDPTQPVEFARITQRATPTIASGQRGDELATRICRGEISFFDVPFDDKILVRRGATPWVSAGAHDVGARDVAEARLDASQFSCAHVALAGRRGLEVRAQMASRVIESADRTDHGWQTRMVAEVARSGDVGGFWSRHCIGAGSDPPTVFDASLASSVRVTLDSLEARGVDLSRPNRALSPQVSFHIGESTALGALDSLQGVARALVHGNDELRARVDQLTHRIDYLETQLDVIVADRTRLLDERERLISQRQAMLESTSWKIGSRIVRPIKRRRA